MAPESHQPDAIGSELSWMAGASTNSPPGETKQLCSRQLVPCDAEIVVTENMTQATQLTMVWKTASSKNKKQHTIGCQ